MLLLLLLMLAFERRNYWEVLFC